MQVSRAFAHFLALANTAETHNKVRALREELMALDQVSPFAPPATRPCTAPAVAFIIIMIIVIIIIIIIIVITTPLLLVLLLLIIIAMYRCCPCRPARAPCWAPLRG
jgi:Flp pilus assembly protein TadB